MGNYSSIINSDTQKISTNITQISTENCLNTCLQANNQLNITIIGTTLNGDINFSEACYINGASCILKAAVSNSLINDQTSKQKGNIKDEEDPFDFLADFIPSSNQINQSNFQSIADNITQMVNSTCQNSTDISDNDLNITFEGDIVNGNVNLNLAGSSTNSKCIINNMTKNYVDNSQYSSQTASIVRESCLAGLGVFLGLILLLVAAKALFHDSHKDKQQTPTPNGSPNASPTGTAKASPGKTVKASPGKTVKASPSGTAKTPKPEKKKGFFDRLKEKI